MNASIAIGLPLLLGVLLVNEGTRVAGGAVRELLKARGIRNNNPGNLSLTDIPWRGKVPPEENTDGRFEQFYFAVDGIRAMARDLKTDYAQGLRSLRELITEWAPPTENNTDAYVAAVAARTGLDPDAPLTLDAHLYELVDAIIHHENGGNPYPPSLVLQGVHAA